MSAALDAMFGPKNWKAFPPDQALLSGALLLLDSATGKPREIVSRQDFFFVVQAVGELYPADELNEVVMKRKRYLVRQPQRQRGSEF